MINMQLFNLENNGGGEIVDAVGMISDNVDFSKWKPVLPLAMRRLSAIVGDDVMSAICERYANGEEKELISVAQKPVAFFAWGMMIPTLDAQHGGSGRQKKLGENEKGLTALQEFKDEQNIMNLAYESVDALIEFLENGDYDFWKQSEAKRLTESLLLRNKNEFDRYYVIGSHRLYYTLTPLIREVQETEIAPIVGDERMLAMQKKDPEFAGLLEQCRRPLTLLTIKKAVERLPIEVIPDGIVQVQQVGSVKEKTKAEKEARRQVSESLRSDAERYLHILQDTVTQMDNDPTNDDLYVYHATLQSKGITF